MSHALLILFEMCYLYFFRLNEELRIINLEYSRIPKKHELENKEKNMKIEIDEMKKEIQQIKVDIVNQKVCFYLLIIYLVLLKQS